MEKKYSKKEIAEIYHTPLLELVGEAFEIHKKYFQIGDIQKSRLFSIKTGSCPEDCSYCSQSSHYKTELKKEKVFDVKMIIEDANKAKAEGADRYCMGAAWKAVKDGEEFENVKKMISEVKNVGLETCATLGMISLKNAVELKKSGLDYYNHNINTSPEFYKNIVTTHAFDDRLKTIRNIQEAGLKLCSGGILGLGENDNDRISFIHALASFTPPPYTIPINNLIPIKGTPLETAKKISNLEIIRTIACIRIVIPQASIRLSAGRSEMNIEAQALCFLAGANSVFIGEKLLTTENTSELDDVKLFSELGLKH
jgi:biotin synthase